MIYWMSERTSRILQAANIGAIGYGPERDGECAAVTLEMPDESLTLWLGDISGMPPEEIDAHFGEEVLSLGLAIRDDRLISVGRELMSAQRSTN